MKTVILKNGAEEDENFVNVTMMSLRSLMKEHPLDYYELIQLCKDSNHQLFGIAEQRLNFTGLLQNGIVHSSIHNIVLSATEGESFDMRIVNPIK